MDWPEILAHFRQLYVARGLTQEALAARGGIDQNDVSRLLKNDRLGPYVQTFVRAVHGLGMSLGEFFADLDAAAAAHHSDGQSAAPPAAGERAPLRATSSSTKPTRARATPRQKERAHVSEMDVPSPHRSAKQQRLNLSRAMARLFDAMADAEIPGSDDRARPLSREIAKTPRRVRR